MLQEPQDRIHPQTLNESGPEQDGDVNVICGGRPRRCRTVPTNHGVPWKVTHGVSAARSFSGHVTKPHSSEESNDPTRSARWRRECRLATQPADHAQHGKAGDAASGPREEREGGSDATSGPREDHVGQHVDVRAARRKSEAREEELEQVTSRDVNRDEQSQREPAVKQRRALDGVDS